MEAFLFWIGLYNTVGPLALLAMSHERFADWMLRRLTEMITFPYTHGDLGRLWLWWAGSANIFMGVVMMLATRWDIQAQREVCLGVIGVYLVMYLVVIIGARGPRYGRGISSLHVLWPAQMLWGLWGLWSSGW